MADTPSPPTPDPRNDPNGERIAFTMGTKSVGITARDLIPVLLLIAGIVGGYLIFVQINTSLERIYTQNVQFHGIQHQGVDELQETMRTSVTQCSEMLRDQNTRMETLAQRILEQFVTSRQDREAQTEIIRQYLLRHEYNQDRAPDQRIPLEIPQAPPELKTKTR